MGVRVTVSGHLGHVCKGGGIGGGVGIELGLGIGAAVSELGSWEGR